jgi:hypothetical protein
MNKRSIEIQETNKQAKQRENWPAFAKDHNNRPFGAMNCSYFANATNNGRASTGKASHRPTPLRLRWKGVASEEGTLGQNVAVRDLGRSGRSTSASAN